jgi:hypothetical protein
MKREVTMKFEVAENGLIVRKREGNKWGPKKWVVTTEAGVNPFSGIGGGQSVMVGHLVRDALFGPPENQPAEEKS